MNFHKNCVIIRILKMTTKNSDLTNVELNHEYYYDMVILMCNYHVMTFLYFIQDGTIFIDFDSFLITIS